MTKQSDKKKSGSKSTGNADRYIHTHIDAEIHVQTHTIPNGKQRICKIKTKQTKSPKTSKRKPMFQLYIMRQRTSKEAVVFCVFHSLLGLGPTLKSGLFPQ